MERVSDADRLRLYAWFKQTAAPATSTAQPSRLAITARAKWDAWHAARGLSLHPVARMLTTADVVPPATDSLPRSRMHTAS